MAPSRDMMTRLGQERHKLRLSNFLDHRAKANLTIACESANRSEKLQCLPPLRNNKYNSSIA
jgi:hypothetical protein